MQWYFYVITLIIICNILGSYENGIEKVKLAEQFSDIDNCTDSETSKKLRQKHAKRRYNIDSDDEIDSNDETLSSLPPPPKMPTLANKYPTKCSKSQPSNECNNTSKVLKDSSNFANKEKFSPRKDSSNSANKEKVLPRNILPSSSKICQQTNSTNFKEKSSSLSNNSDLVTKIQLFMSTYATDNGNVLFITYYYCYKLFALHTCFICHAIICLYIFIYAIEVAELKKELLRRTNQIFAKLESFDDKLDNIQEKIGGVGQGINNNICDFTEIVSLPLQNQDDVKALEHNLKEKEFFSKMVGE